MGTPRPQRPNRLAEYTSADSAVPFSPPIEWVEVVSAGSGGLVLLDESGATRTLSNLTAGTVYVGPWGGMTSTTCARVRFGDGPPPSTQAYAAVAAIATEAATRAAADAVLTAFDADLGDDATGKGASMIAIEDSGTLYAATDVEGALAEVRALADTAYDGRILTKTATVAKADVDGLGAGVKTYTANVGTALPAGAQVLGCNVLIGVDFTDGAAGTYTVEVGYAEDVDAIVYVANVASSTDGNPATFTLGAAPFRPFAAGKQITVKLTSSVDLNTTTAGTFTVTLLYFVP